MTDNEIRIAILDYLKKVYDEHPHAYANFESAFDFSGVELIRNIRYLSEKGLIDVDWFVGGSFQAKINSYGIDMIERIQQEVQAQQAAQKEMTTPDVLPSLIKETKDYVDSKLADINPEILEKLNLICEDLMMRRDSHSFARIAYDCREILMDFTDGIFKEDFVEAGEKKPLRNQTKNKIRIFLRNKTTSETTSRAVSERFDYIMNYFDYLSSEIQKNAHPSGFKVTSEDAKSCLIYTYMFMRDILKIVD
ncbi:MAG: hypothetical protein HZA11_13290 [Nitrospirae bacterium]|nr:hypothetical protein [Nitrospirota bacterium]